MDRHRLSQADIDRYRSEGFLVLRGAIDEAEIRRLEEGLARARPVDKTLEPTAPVYPEPGRYTYATQCPIDPDLAFVIEHPAIVTPVSQLLGDAPRLSAYVMYDRWPGGPGIPAHQDYKRWRPVGSSMNWLFATVPFTDFDDEVGPLQIAPRSHRLERISEGTTPCLEVAPALRPAEDDFVDPALKRGDLLLMNMHLWHRAPGNTSNRHRVGLFNKYAGASSPPATGWYRYDARVRDALAPAHRDLIASHGDPAIARTRAVIVRQREAGPELLCLPATSETDGPAAPAGRWTLPGGEAREECALADWDHGNVIGALEAHLRAQIGGEPPWMSFIGDFVEAEGVSRVYGYEIAQGRLVGPQIGAWHTVTEIKAESFAFGWEPEAVARWLDPTVNRGKGLSQAKARVDQFAY